MHRSGTSPSACCRHSFLLCPEPHVSCQSRSTACQSPRASTDAPSRSCQSPQQRTTTGHSQVERQPIGSRDIASRKTDTTDGSQIMSVGGTECTTKTRECAHAGPHNTDEQKTSRNALPRLLHLADYPRPPWCPHHDETREHVTPSSDPLDTKQRNLMDKRCSPSSMQHGGNTLSRRESSFPLKCQCTTTHAIHTRHPRCLLRGTQN